MFVLLAGVLTFAGCASVPRKGAVPAAGQTNAPTVKVTARDSEEVQNRRAEAHARFMAASSLEVGDDLAAAEQEYEKALLADPSNEQLALDLTRRFVQRKEFARAEKLLMEVTRSPDATAAMLSRLAFVFLQQGKTNQLIEANRAAIKRQPGSMAGYQGLYTFYRQTGQTNESRRVLEQASRQPKPDAEFLVDLAMMYLLEDTPKRNTTNILISSRATDALKRAAAMSPTNFFVLQKLAQGLRMTGETKKASEIYQKLLDQFPGIPGAREELAEMLLRSNDNDGAAEQLEAIVRDNPTNPQAYYFLGAIAYEKGKFNEAVEYYRKSLLLNPNFEQVYYDLAAAKIAVNEPHEALDYLKQAKKRFKESFVGEFFTAIAHVRMKEFTNALNHFTAAELIAATGDTNRLTHSFYFQFGSASERAGRITEAVGLFEKALKMSPDFAEALNYLGYMWAERGTNLDRARKMIERAVSLQPTNAAYLDSLAWVLFKQGDARAALGQMEKAMRFNTDPDATLFDHLGDIHAALKQADKAREFWRKALDLEPNEEIEKKLRALPGSAPPAKER